MPNRMIKDSIRTSRSVNALSDFHFRVWTYLITYVDDFGRGSADPELLKGLVFPRRKTVTEAQIYDALESLESSGMIYLYKVDGEPYFCFPNWSMHQRIQSKKPKFPAPPDIPKDYGDSRKPTEDFGESPPKTKPNQTELETELKEADASCAEPVKPPAAPPVITLPLNDGSEYPISQEQCHEWAGLYPAVDVIQQLRGMRGWLLANPTKRKTKRGILRFIAGWLAREQDRGRRNTPLPQMSSPDGRNYDVMSALGVKT